MSLPLNLLSHAAHLLNILEQPQSDVARRRAVSASYYALFHKINEDAVKLIAPNVSAETNHRIQRFNPVPTNVTDAPATFPLHVVEALVVDKWLTRKGIPGTIWRYGMWPLIMRPTSGDFSWRSLIMTTGLASIGIAFTAVVYVVAQFERGSLQGVAFAIGASYYFSLTALGCSITLFVLKRSVRRIGFVIIASFLYVDVLLSL